MLSVERGPVMMNFTHLPTDIHHNIALELSIEQLCRLCTDKGTVEKIHDHDRFWQRRYRRDFGYDTIFDDCPHYSWRRRYRVRRQMNTLWDTGEKRDIKVAKVSSCSDWRVTLNLDGSVTEYEPYDDHVVSRHDHIDAVDIYPGVCGNCLYGLRHDGTITHRHRHNGAFIESGWPKSKYIVPTGDEEVILVTPEYSVYIVNVDSYHPTGEIHECIGLKAKWISISSKMGAYIDPDDNVWFSKDFSKHWPVRELKDTTWRRFFGMKGKRVTCSNGALILIDLNDNLWSFGDKNKCCRLGVGDVIPYPNPVRIEGVKGKSVYMDNMSTIIIDIHHNPWLCGFNGYNILGLNKDMGIVKYPMRWHNFKALCAYLGDPFICVVGARLEDDGYPQDWCLWTRY